MKFIGEHRIQEDTRFVHCNVYLPDSIADPGADTDKFLVYGTNGLLGYRTGAEVLSDIGGLSTSATAAAASLVAHVNQALDPTCFVTFATAATGNLAASTNAALTFNSTNGDLGATTVTTTSGINAVGTIHVDGTASQSGRLELSEDTDEGAHFVRIGVPALAASTNFVLPNDEGTDGYFLKTDGSGNTSWAEASGGGGIAFDGSTANGVLTFKDSDEATVEANMTYDGDDLTLTSSSASQPILTMQSTHTHGGRAAELKFIKDAADTSNGEALGFITWYGDDDAGNNQQFIKIKGEIEESGSGNEGGKLTVYVASHDGSETQGLVVEDGDASGEVDVTLGNGSKSIVTCPGKLVAKTIQCFSANFFDDLGTTKHYVPLSTQSTSEQTSDGNTLVDFLAPCDLSIREVMLKLPASTTGSGNITAGIETSNIGATPTTKSSVETETVAVTSSNDNDIVHFRFNEATHATLGQNVCVTIQSDSDLSSSQNWYVNVIMELDWNTMHTGSSSVQTS